MKQVKFRGWQPELNKWIYGSLVTMPQGGAWILDYQTGFEDRIRINANTVGQFTGLTDKNGKEIYEGDILNLHIFVEELGPNYGVCEGEREYVGFICFEELGLAFKRSADDEEWFYLVYTPGMLHEESFDIIGNTHKNPELLK